LAGSVRNDDDEIELVKALNKNMINMTHVLVEGAPPSCKKRFSFEPSQKPEIVDCVFELLQIFYFFIFFIERIPMRVGCRHKIKSYLTLCRTINNDFEELHKKNKTN
jgi:hypothetical protein